MRILFFVPLLLSIALIGHAGSTHDPLSELKETLQLIKKAKQIDFELEKITQSEFTGEKKSKGTASLSGTLFFMELTGSFKEVVIYDNKNLWVAQYPDSQFPGPVQVLQTQMTGKQKDQLLLSALLQKGKLLEWFDIKKVESEGKQSVYLGTPKNKTVGLQEVLIKIEKKELRFLEYKDEIGNKVQFVVSNQKILKSVNSAKFKFKIPKGAQVSKI